MIKRKIKCIIAWILCCTFLVSTIYKINDIFRFKIQQYDSFKLFYELDKDTVDVLAIGCSSLYQSINPHILYDEYGISSFTLGQGGLLTNYDYYYLVEALKTQSPQVLILDTVGLRVNKEIPQNIAMNFTSGLKLSKNKIDLFWNEIPIEQWKELLLKYPMYHSRYNELSSADFLPWRGEKAHQYDKGEIIAWTTDEADFEYTLDANAVKTKREPTEETINYLLKILDLAQKNNIEVVLYAAPYAISEEEQELQVWVKEFAIENGILYIDGNVQREEIGVQIPQDILQDGYHLNHEGNKKVSKYIGEFLINNFDLPDRRNDDQYYSWQMGAECYKETNRNFVLKSIVSFQKYLDKVFENDNYTVVIIKVGECDDMFDSVEVVGALESNEAVIWNHGKLTYILPDSDTWYTECSSRDTLTLIKQNDMWNHLYVNDIEYGLANNAVNFFVYDNLLETVVESAYWTDIEKEKNQ